MPKQVKIVGWAITIIFSCWWIYVFFAAWGVQGYPDMALNRIAWAILLIGGWLIITFISDYFMKRKDNEQQRLLNLQNIIDRLENHMQKQASGNDEAGFGAKKNADYYQGYREALEKTLSEYRKQYSK